MTNEEIFGKLKVIIDDILGNTEINLETALIEGGLMDSLELINYLTQIEETFGLNISMDELIEHQLGKIGNLVKFIGGKI
jgi:acyl carrier protein